MRHHDLVVIDGRSGNSIVDDRLALSTSPSSGTGSSAGQYRIHPALPEVLDNALLQHDLNTGARVALAQIR